MRRTPNVVISLVLLALIGCNGQSRSLGPSANDPDRGGDGGDDGGSSGTSGLGGGSGQAGSKANGGASSSGGASAGTTGDEGGRGGAEAGAGGDGSGGAGVGGAGGSGGGIEPPCEEGALRCLREVGTRERCAGGEWNGEDFACAISVRVEPYSGYPCAAKADGRFLCWGNGFSSSQPAPTFPERVVSVHGGNDVYSSWDGTFFLLENGGLRFATGGTTTLRGADVVSFDYDHISRSLCVTRSDGGVICDRSDLLAKAIGTSPRPFRQVATSENDTCVLDESDRASCAYSLLPGRYEELALGHFSCALTLEGAIECASPWGYDLGIELPSGPFFKIAMADETVCGIRPNGAIACAGLEGQAPVPPEGAFTDIDGGDRTLCAVHVDGSVRCFSAYAAVGLLEVPAGW